MGNSLYRNIRKNKQKYDFFACILEEQIQFFILLRQLTKRFSHKISTLKQVTFVSSTQKIPTRSVCTVFF